MLASSENHQQKQQPQPEATTRPFKMHEISTNSILATSALLHATFHQEHQQQQQQSSSLASSTTTATTREDAVVSPDNTSDAAQQRQQQHNQQCPSLIDQVVSSEHSVQVNSPLEGPREVRFTGVPQLSLSDEEDFGLENNTRDEEVEMLHQQLKNALANLSAEKAMRSRKEKNLVKLAKELNKRSEDADLKERKLVEMAETVNTLQASLRHQRADHCADQERHLAFVADSEERSSRLEQAAAALRSELAAAKLQIDALRGELLDAEEKRSKSTRTWQRLFYYCCGLGAVLLAVLVGRCFSFPTSVRDAPIFPGTMLLPNPLERRRSSFLTGVRNAACAPIFPGTKLLPNQPGLFEAPWWAPVGNKAAAHRLVCSGSSSGSSVRSRLQWKGDKLVVYDSNNDDTVLFEGRGPAGVRVGANQIQFLSRHKGRAVESSVSAPWAMM